MPNIFERLKDELTSEWQDLKDEFLHEPYEDTSAPDAFLVEILPDSTGNLDDSLEKAQQSLEIQIGDLEETRARNIQDKFDAVNTIQVDMDEQIDALKRQAVDKLSTIETVPDNHVAINQAVDAQIDVLFADVNEINDADRQLVQQKAEALRDMADMQMEEATRTADKQRVKANNHFIEEEAALSQACQNNEDMYNIGMTAVSGRLDTARQDSDNLETRARCQKQAMYENARDLENQQEERAQALQGQAILSAQVLKDNAAQLQAANNVNAMELEGAIASAKAEYE